MRRLYLVLALFVLLLSSCEIQNPVLPEWDVELNIPLMNTKFYVSDLVDSVNVVLTDGEVLTLRGTGSVSTPPLGAITINPDIMISYIPIISGFEGIQKIPFSAEESGVCLSYGLIESGLLGVNFDNIVVPPSILKLSILELQNSDGEPFKINYQGETGWNNYDLHDYRIGTENSGVLLDSLTIKISCQSSLPDETPLGSFGFRANTPLSLSSIQGGLNNYELALEQNTSAINIDYPFGIENAIELQHASLMISITNQLGFECEFIGELYAENTRNGTKESIPIVDNDGNNYLIAAATTNGPVTTDLLFENNISRLMQIMPDVIQIQKARFVIKCSGASIGFANSSDIITGNYQVDAPFTFILHNSEIKMQDPIKIEISEDNRNFIRNNARYANLDLRINNRLPIGFKAGVYIGKDKDISPDNPSSWLMHKEIALHSKQWADEHLPSSAEGYQEFSILMDETEIQFFDNPELFLLWSFSFDESSEVVSITASPADYIQIISMIPLGFRIKE